MNWNTITIIFICSTSLEGKISPWFLPPYFLVNNEVMSHHVYTLHSQCPHHSPLPTGKMTVRNWEKRKGEEEWREGEGRELTKSCLTFTARTPTNLCFFLLHFPARGWWLWGCWTRIIKLKNIEHSVILKDFIRILFSKISCGKLEEQTSLSLFTSLYPPPPPPSPASGILTLSHLNALKCKKSSILSLSWASKTISGRVMAWWLDGLYL